MRAISRLGPPCPRCETKPRFHYAARGVTLVEIMVAMVIGLIITFAIVQIFSSTRSAYQLDEGLARSQENGRFALEFITRDVREAGLFGCTRTPRITNNLNSSTTAAFDFSSPVYGFEATNTAPGDSVTLGSASTGWAPAIDATLAPSGEPGSDVLVVRMVTGAPLQLGAASDTDKVYLAAGEGSKIVQGAMAVVSNCDTASIFQVTNAPLGSDVLEHQTAGGGSPGNACATWGTGCVDQPYGLDAEAYALQTYVYYIRQGANGGPALWRAWYTPGGATLAAQELVSNVENMQVLYGVDLDGGEYVDGDADRYYTAAEVDAASPPLWNYVVSVRLSLLAASDQSTGSAADTVADTSAYLLGGVDTGTAISVTPPANDFKRRRVFDTTIQIRNRGV